MGKKNKFSIPSDSAVRSAWSAVALSSGLLVPLGSWTLTDRTGATKLTGKDPGVVGTYLVIGEKATMYATLGDLSDFFKGLR